VVVPAPDVPLVPAAPPLPDVPLPVSPPAPVPAVTLPVPVPTVSPDPLVLVVSVEPPPLPPVVVALPVVGWSIDGNPEPAPSAQAVANDDNATQQKTNVGLIMAFTNPSTSRQLALATPGATRSAPLQSKVA
jgi:hypothetical protein